EAHATTLAHALLRGDLGDGGRLAGAGRAHEHLHRREAVVGRGQRVQLIGERRVQVRRARVAALLHRMRRGDGPGNPWFEAARAEPRRQRLDLAVNRIVDGMTERRHVWQVRPLDRCGDLYDGATYPSPGSAVLNDLSRED